MSGSPLDSAFLAELRAVAEMAARAGGAVSRSAFDRPPGVRLKSDASVVTDADIAAQAAVIASIQAARRDDDFIGEESAESSEGGSGLAASTVQGAASRITWLIDPIDGTRNFVRGSAAFACSVGALRDGAPVAGAIYEPLRDAMYAADVSNGFFVNGIARPLGDSETVRGPSGPRGELVVSLPSTATPPIAALMHACVDHCVIRNVGSAALHLAMLATGEIDAALMATCKLWDLAAGAALVAAAGGVFVELDGRPLFPIHVATRAATELPSLVARNAVVADRILKLVAPR